MRQSRRATVSLLFRRRDGAYVVSRLASFFFTADYVFFASRRAFIRAFASRVPYAFFVFGFDLASSPGSTIMMLKTHSMTCETMTM